MISKFYKHEIPKRYCNNQSAMKHYNPNGGPRVVSFLQTKNSKANLLFSYNPRQLPFSLKKGHSSFLSTCVFLSKRLTIKLKFFFLLPETYNLFPFLFFSFHPCLQLPPPKASRCYFFFLLKNLPISFPCSWLFIANVECGSC